MRVVFNRPQAEVHSRFAPGWTVSTPWGRGVGKSHFIRRSKYLDVVKYDGQTRSSGLITVRGVRIVLMLPTFKQATDLYAQPLLDDLTGDGEWAFLGAHINRTTWKITFPGSSWIQLFGAENAAASRGLRCDEVYCDEGDDIAPSVFDSVISPWFSESVSLKKRLVGGTPRRGRHGLLYRTHARGAGIELDRSVDPPARFDQHFSYHATGYDVPDTVDPAYLEKMRRETPVPTFKREWLCDFDAAEGLVYPHFFESEHVRLAEPGERFREYIGGVDWGFNHPAVFLVFGVTGSGRVLPGGGADIRIRLLDERTLVENVPSQIADEARRLRILYPECVYYADPSQPGTIESLRRETGIKIVAAENSVEEGIGTVSDALLVRTRTDLDEEHPQRTWSQLTVDPSAVNTIREFGMYRRKRYLRDPDDILDVVEKRNDDHMDALRYALHSHFGGTDKRLTQGYSVQ